MKYILLLSLFFVSSFSLAEETSNTETKTEQVDAQALFDLGDRYFKTARLFPKEEKLFIVKNFKRAFDLFEQAAKLGHTEAQIALGWFYLSGYAAITRGLTNEEDIKNDPVFKNEDFHQSIYWLDKAAEQGDAKIQYHVARILYDGYIWERGNHLEYKKKALHWLTISAAQGNQEAIDLLNEINSADETEVIVNNDNSADEVEVTSNNDNSADEVEVTSNNDNSADEVEVTSNNDNSVDE